MLTAATIIDRANQIAKTNNYTTLGLDGLNAILSDLCQETDLAASRGLFQFNFNPALTSLFGSGPYPLPVDYLRTSGSSGATGATKSAWFLYPAPSFPNGQPMPLVPVDLAQFDQYPQLNAQGLPSVIATDMGGPLTQRIVLATTAGLTKGSVTFTPTASTGIAVGLGVAGEGITPGTTVATITPTFTLSVAATATITSASVFFGIAPVAYVYPPPVGSYPVTIRYQRQMPPLTNTAQYPWFSNDGYLIDRLASDMMKLSGDTRSMEFSRRAGAELTRFLGMVDDKTNRAQQVQLDARNFGGGGQYARLKNTKVAGW